jgi:hypothetical protein
MVFIIYFMYVQIRSLFHLKCAYFSQFWSYIELSIISCSWSSVAIYVWRYREMNRILTFFRQTNGRAYVSLQLATYVNEVLTSLLAFCCFLGSIRLLRLCRFTRRLSLLGDTLRHARKALCLFIVTFFIVFMAFLFLFYFLFASKIWACSSLLQTARMLFEMILFQFDATNIQGADAFLGPISFVLFIFFVVFIGMTMFISIINDSFRTVRKNSRLSLNEEHDMFAFMWNRFRRWTGFIQFDCLFII